MVMRILIVGGGGQLGQDAMRFFSETGHEVSALAHDALDIRHLRAVREAVASLKPAVLLNAAAWANVDLCQQDQDAAYGHNTLGPRNLAIAAEEHGILLVHVSTDYVFDGQRTVGAYRESDPTHPLQVYGLSKEAAEREVRALTARHLILRVASLFGSLMSNNFVRHVLHAARTPQDIPMVTDQSGSPTYTWDFLTAAARLMEDGAYGLYHIVNEGEASRYDWARAVLQAAQRDPARVVPILSSQVPRPAARPRRTPLDMALWRSEGRQVLPSWQDAVGRYIARLERAGQL